MSNRKVTAGVQDEEDKKFESALRPRRLADFTGQPKLKENLAIAIEAARQRGEIAIGYRQKAYLEDAARAYGVVLNPVKSAPLTLAAADRVIVLAEDGFQSA